MHMLKCTETRWNCREKIALTISVKQFSFSSFPSANNNYAKDIKRYKLCFVSEKVVRTSPKCEIYCERWWWWWKTKKAKQNRPNNKDEIEKWMFSLLSFVCFHVFIFIPGSSSQKTTPLKGMTWKQMKQKRKMIISSPFFYPSSSHNEFHFVFSSFCVQLQLFEADKFETEFQWEMQF